MLKILIYILEETLDTYEMLISDINFILLNAVSIW